MKRTFDVTGMTCAAMLGACRESRLERPGRCHGVGEPAEEQAWKWISMAKLPPLPLFPRR